MSGKLSQRLLTEMRRSPKKAALLALLAIVALCYWAPLVSRFVNKSTKTNSTAARPQGLDLTAAVSIPQPPVAAPPAMAPAPPKESRPTWQQVLAWIERDPRKLSAAGLPVVRNPFQPVLPEESPLDTPQDEAASMGAMIATAPALPEKVQVPLTAIMIGATRKTALIGGRPYQMGETFTQTGTDYLLESVDRDRVVVRRLADGKRFEQPLPRASSAVQLEIRRLRP